MSKNSEKMSLGQMANQFIEMANMFVDQDGQPLNDVGAALRYATARMNAWEFTRFSKNPVAEKEHAISWFVDLYTQDLREHIDDTLNTKC